MQRTQAIEILRQLRAPLQARGIEHIGLFGSVARDQYKPDASDIDIVVTPKTGSRLDLVDFGAVQDLLEASFQGLSVDVVVEPVRRESLRQAIARDSVHAF